MESIYLTNTITDADARNGGVTIMGKQMIGALKAGDRVDSYFSVAYKKPVSEYKYGHMFEFRVADRTGQITVKYWGGENRPSVEKLQSSLERGGVVRIVGEVGEYRGQLEVSVSEKNGGTIDTLESGEYDLSSLVVSLEGLAEMKERLLNFARMVEEPHMVLLLRRFFEDKSFMESFSTCPASIQLHSAAIGGLMHHTLNVAEICSRMLQLQPGLDRDLVIAGALLHDIGKTRSFVISTNINHTVEGNLIGHLIVGDELLMEQIRSIEDFPADLVLKLRHVIASHHGRKEWGSPVEPMMPEALLIHMADDMDAKLNYMALKREEAETEDDWTWDRRLSRLIYLG